MAKTLAPGTYFVGMVLGADDSTSYWLVPVIGNSIMWGRAKMMTQDEFGDFQRARERRREERLHPQPQQEQSDGTPPKEPPPA
jgi:hypothetical protein